MPAAVCKSDLLAVCEAEFAKLSATLDGVDAATAELAGDDDFSIKDTVAHRAHWIDLYLGWVSDGRAGEDVATPAPGYKWNALKVYNAMLREQMSGLTWPEARAALDAAHLRLMEFLKGEDDASLYTPHLMPWMNKWTLGRWAEASGASHYRSANKYIRKIIRTQVKDR